MNEIVMSSFPMPSYVTISRQYRILSLDEIVEIDKYSKDNNCRLDMFKFAGTKTESEYLAFNDPRDNSPVCMKINDVNKLREEGKI